MSKINVYSFKSSAKLDRVRSLPAVCLAIALGSLILGQSGSAQEETAPQKSRQAPSNAEAPLSDKSAVYMVKKIKDTEKQVKDEINVEEGKKQTLVVRQNEQQKNRDDIDHKARLFDDSEQSQATKRDVDNYHATCMGRTL